MLLDAPCKQLVRGPEPPRSVTFQAQLFPAPRLIDKEYYLRSRERFQPTPHTTQRDAINNTIDNYYSTAGATRAAFGRVSSAPCFLKESETGNGITSSPFSGRSLKRPKLLARETREKLAIKYCCTGEVTVSSQREGWGTEIAADLGRRKVQPRRCLVLVVGGALYDITTRPPALN